MFDQIDAPAIREAAGEPINQPYRAIGHAQQKTASITRHRAAIERLMGGSGLLAGGIALSYVEFTRQGVH